MCNIPIWIINKQMSLLNTIVNTPDVLSELALISMNSTTGLNNFKERVNHIPKFK